MTNKNEYDDAELDLFLQGRGELSDRLKALGELIDSPGPSAELDAAILANIELALAQDASAASDATAAAANDSVVPEVQERQPLHRLSSSWTTRWRVPVGLAAGLLLGVLLHRSFRSEDPLDSVAHYSEASNSAAAPPTSAAPQRRAEPPQLAGAESAKPKSTNGELAEKRKGTSSVSTTTPSVAPPAMQVATADSIALDSHYARPAASAPAPAPAPAPKPALAEVQRVEVTGSNIRRVESESASPTQVVAAEDLPKNPAAPNQTPSGFNPEKRASESGYATPAPVIAPSAPIASPTGPVALARSPAATIVTAASQTPKSPHEWVVLIQENLKAGRNDEAVQDWAIFRKAYPDYAVRPELTEKITALQSHQDQK